MIKLFVIDVHNKTHQIKKFDLSIFINCRHLKLEIALAIPASTDDKIETNRSASHGLSTDEYTERDTR